MAQTHSTTLVAASNQYWSIADASQTGLDFTGDFSASMWVKFTTLPSSGNQMILLGKYGYENNTRQYYFSVHNNAGTYRLRLATSTNGTAFTEGNVTWSTPTTGVWYHVGFSKSGTTVTMYVDGSSIGTATVDNTLVNSTATFAIGVLVGGAGGTDSPIDAEIDEVIVYSTAIAGNMSTNFNTPCSPYTTSAVSEWQFNNNGNDNIGANNLTNNNSATFTTDVPFVCAAGGGVSLLMLCGVGI